MFELRGNCVAAFCQKSRFKKLNNWLIKNNSKDVKLCMEATGHYCFAVADFFYNKGYKVYVINPFCIKSFSKGQLMRNKTDEADASMIANYIAKNEARLYKPAPKAIRKLQELDKCLDGMKVSKAQIKTKLTELTHVSKEVYEVWKNTEKFLDKQIQNLEKSLLELINADSELKENYENLQTILGISTTSAITLLALLPDISEFINARQFARATS